MKRKVIAAAVLFAAALVCNLFLSAVIHQLLSHSFGGINTLRIQYCLQSLFSSPKHAALFLCLQTVAGLGMFPLLFNRWGDYTGALVQITPDIQIPVPAGQYQHGSAWWLDKKEFPKTFYPVQLDTAWLKQLAQQGEADLDGKTGGIRE